MSAVLAGWLGVALAADPVPEKRTSGYVTPTFSADSDDGIGGGLRAELAKLAPGHDPYKVGWMVHAHATSKGYHHHRLRWDRVGLGPEGRLRLTGRLSYRQWTNDGYFGIGNGTLRADLRGVEKADFHLYGLVQPVLHLVAQHDLDAEGRWSAYGTLSPKYSAVKLRPGSQLENHEAHGIAGGPMVQVGGGMVFDTRDREVAPSQGVRVELGGRVAPGLGEFSREAAGFGGPLASTAVFVPMGGRVVWAQRWLGEWLLGTIPFYEMVHWGGAAPIAGVGGADTVRGIRFGRWRAPGKAVLNQELRVTVLTHPFLAQRSLAWELAPFVDAATVWGADLSQDALAPEAPGLPVHPGVGMGLRLVFDETFVGRAELAWGQDMARTADPPAGWTTDRSEIPVWTPGFYLAFGHPF